MTTTDECLLGLAQQLLKKVWSCQVLRQATGESEVAGSCDIWTFQFAGFCLLPALENPTCSVNFCFRRDTKSRLFNL